MKVNKYFPFAFIYFFVNSVALPFGVTYTALLAPFFYFWILLRRKKEIVFPFVIILTPFIIMQVLYVDVVRKVYFYSLLNVIFVYIFCQAVYTFLNVALMLKRYSGDCSLSTLSFAWYPLFCISRPGLILSGSSKS